MRQLVADLFSEEGYVVHQAGDYNTACEEIRSVDFDVALVDLRLKGKDGMDLVRLLRQRDDVGIIIVSGKVDVVDRIVGLEMGADDYLTKPFDLRELLARVKRTRSRIEQIRTEAPKEIEQLSLGAWTVDPNTFTAIGEDGERVELTSGELRTLRVLLTRRGEVVTRDLLHREVIGKGQRDPNDRRIDVYVSGIRKKLGLAAGRPGHIRTVHRVGYVVD